jgi:DNA polymerase-1
MLVQTEQQLDEVLQVLSNSETIVFDFETLSAGKYPEIDDEDAALHHKTLEIEGVSFRSETLEPVFVPFKDTQISRIVLIEKLKALFSLDAPLFVAHNIQFDAKLAEYFIGARPKRKFCTMVAYWYLDENARKDKVTLGRQIFGMPTISYKEAKKLGPEEFLAYTLRDAEFAHLLHDYEVGAFKERHEENLFGLVTTLEMDFIDVLIDMTLYGTPCDIAHLKKGEEILTNKATELEAKIYKEYGEFNLKSPIQLCEKIYGIKVSRKGGVLSLDDSLAKQGGYAAVGKETKGGAPSTDDETLAKLKTPVARLIQEYRSVVKCLDTYAVGYQKWVINGKIWPSFNHVGTVSGRLSSEKPNMQNLPHNPTEGWWIREAIYAPEGYDLIVADESQLEVRLLAHFSQDAALMAAIWSGKDVHEATANLVFNKKVVSKEERRFAKTLNFSISYGQGIIAIGETLGVSKEEAKEFRKKYFNTFPDVLNYTNYVAEVMRQQGYVKTLLGRKRRVPEINSLDNGEQARAKRQTLNSIIQGSASDVLKAAMVHIHKEFKKQNLDAHILLQVHDELVIQSRKDHTEEACKIVKQYMEHPLSKDLRVPLFVEPKIVYKWSEAKD